MPSASRRILPIAGAMLLALSLQACSSSGLSLVQQRTQGYSIPKDALEQVRAGQHRDTVALVMGSPQTTNSFGNQTAWYYVETKVEETAFGASNVKERTVLAVYFDQNDRVVDKAVYGAKDGRLVQIESRRTPSFGQDRNFLEALVASF
jgi:outer membrane protein assembly factor BamE (lipoprotein component of BamABCDE complex)